MERDRHQRWPMIVRFVLGGTWIAGAAFNLLVTLPRSESMWGDLGEDATFGVYRWFFDSVVGSAPAFWTILLVMGELLLGVLLLGRYPWARYGVILSVAWCVFLFFLIWPWTLSTVIFLAPSIWLLRYRHSMSVADLFHQRAGDVDVRGTRV